MTYVIHLELNHFVSHIVTGTTVWVQDYVRVHHDRYGQATFRHWILASFKGQDGLLHAVHLPVVEVVEADDQRADRSRAVAVKIVKEEIMRMCLLECGLLLEAGLTEDLDRYATTHGLWRWSEGVLVATRREP